MHSENNFTKISKKCYFILFQTNETIQKLTTEINDIKDKQSLTENSEIK